jgi:hypothetical protein
MLRNGKLRNSASILAGVKRYFSAHNFATDCGFHPASSLVSSEEAISMGKLAAARS